MNNGQGQRPFRLPEGDEMIAAMNRGVHIALRAHKAAGVAAVVWDKNTGETVLVPPEDIPDFPEDPDDLPASTVDLPHVPPEPTHASS